MFISNYQFLQFIIKGLRKTFHTFVQKITTFFRHTLLELRVIFSLYYFFTYRSLFLISLFSYFVSFSFFTLFMFWNSTPVKMHKRPCFSIIHISQALYLWLGFIANGTVDFKLVFFFLLHLHLLLSLYVHIILFFLKKRKK